MNKTADNKSTVEKYRPYVLGGVFALMLLYFGGEWLLENVFQGPIEQARRKTDQLLAAKKKKEEALARARSAAELLALWETQSLPSDLESARWLYQAWLVELVEDVKLESPSVNSGEPVLRDKQFYTIAFSVRGRGSLEQLTQFLYFFYRTDLLHQIRSLQITPLGNAEQFDLSMAIEAAVLPGAGPEGRQGATSEERQATVFEDFRQRTFRQSTRLASLNLSDYDPIVTRNLFGTGGKPDPTDFAYLTSINSIDGVPHAWFTLRSSGEVLKLREGASFQIGDFRGTLAAIVGSDVVLESEGERWLLTLGESLTDAYALPPEF